MGLMHRHVTHNRSYPSYNDFCRSVLHFLRTEVPKNWAVFCDSVTGQFPRHQPCRFSGSQGVGVYLTRRAACRIQVARIVARRLQERLGQPVVLENRPGANGGIAAAALVNTPADGYTFMVRRRRDTFDQPAALHQTCLQPGGCRAGRVCLRAHRCFSPCTRRYRLETMKEFIEYVKARPGQLNYGSSGVGSIHHLSMEATKASLQLNMAHVPFKGTGESVPALLGGHVEVLYSAYPSLSGAAGTKLIKLLATNGAQRSSQAPDLPAISEFIPVSTSRRSSESMHALAHLRRSFRKSRRRRSRS